MPIVPPLWRGTRLAPRSSAAEGVGSRHRQWSRSRRSSPALYISGRIALLLVLTAIAWMPLVLLAPVGAALAIAAMTGVLGWWYLLRSRRRDRATLRLRSPGGATVWLCAAVPVWLVFNASLAAAHARWIPGPLGEASPLDELARSPLGWLPLSLTLLLFAPLVEEIFFRGFIQRTLERKLGAARGILLTAALFAAFHLEPWRFGHLLAGGIVFGSFVHASRSLWAGIALHASANASGALANAQGIPLGSLLFPDGSGASLAEHPAFLLGSLAALVALHRAVHRSGTGRPLALSRRSLGGASSPSRREAGTPALGSPPRP